MRDATRSLIAAALSLIALSFVYPIARVGEHFAFGETNPAVVVASNRIALYWRTGIVACFVVALLPVFFELTKRPAAVLRGLPYFIGAASVAMVLQAIFVP